MPSRMLRTSLLFAGNKPPTSDWGRHESDVPLYPTQWQKKAQAIRTCLRSPFAQYSNLFETTAEQADVSSNFEWKQRFMHVYQQSILAL